jgi:hypothetical protein
MVADRFDGAALSRIDLRATGAELGDSQQRRKADPGRGFIGPDRWIRE